MSAHFNRGKKGLALDLRAPAGRDIALALAQRADIVIEGFRPGVAARLGLGYEALAALNPRLLYVSVSGFGDEGPHRAALHRFRGAGFLRAGCGQHRQ
jgi:crotonobetainyl-CoA:carnitine CoA-transferase CaiB-like acyl-CoA transferase